LEVNFAFLCDYADQSGGKLTAIGIGFDTIFAAKIPAVHPLFFSVISLRFSSTEVGQKKIGMRLIDEDGQNVIPPLDATINLPPPPPGVLHRSHRMALALQNVTFKKYGSYAISWLVEGQEVKAVDLKVSEPPQKPGTLPPALGPIQEV
jgi:hypothetical protein